MKGFYDLELFGTRESLEAIVKDIEASLRNGWKRDRKCEGRLNSAAGLDYCCFTCKQRDSRPAAALFLLPDDTYRSLKVVNIVPAKTGQLSHDEYNRILEDFHFSFVKPLAKKHWVRAQLRAPRPWTARPLRGSLKQAMDSVTCVYQRIRHPILKTRSLHPLDRERYWRFIRAAHQYQSTLRPEDIAFHLTTAGFHDELVAELEHEYRIGRQVLAIHDDPWDLRRLRKEERIRRDREDLAALESMFGYASSETRTFHSLAST